MIVALRILFIAILVVMIVSTTWASLQQNIVEGGRELLRQPWGIMTLADAYFGFLTFFVWVAYKESHAVARVLWFVAIMLLGNIAMSGYVLLQLFRLPATARATDLLLRRDQ